MELWNDAGYFELIIFFRRMKGYAVWKGEHPKVRDTGYRKPESSIRDASQLCIGYGTVRYVKN